MKIITIIGALSFSFLVAATPVSRSSRPIIPTLKVVEKLIPGSGIPLLAGKLEKTLDICRWFYFTVIRCWLIYF
jgi:hypothetical protein